jgi:nucleoid-associated protein YgaU
MRMIGALLVFALGADLGSGQDLGEAARLERRRRATLTKHASMLADEDLKKSKILPPKTSATPAVPRIESQSLDLASAVASQVVICDPAECSLGEYARLLRLRKQRRDDAVRLAAAPESPQPKAAPPATAPIMTEPVHHSPAALVPRPQNVTIHAAADLRPAASRATAAAAARPPAPSAIAAAAARPPAAPAPLSISKLQRERVDAKPVTKERPHLSFSRAQPARADAKAKPSDYLHDATSVIVQPGDSLWKISRRYLGDGRLWTLLWKANAEIRKPDLLRPGQSLLLPKRPDVQLARMAVRVRRDY